MEKLNEIYGEKNIQDSHAQDEAEPVQDKMATLKLNVVIMSENAFLEKTFFKERHSEKLYKGPFARTRMKIYVALVDLGII